MCSFYLELKRVKITHCLRDNTQHIEQRIERAVRYMSKRRKHCQVNLIPSRVKLSTEFTMTEKVRARKLRKTTSRSRCSPASRPALCIVPPEKLLRCPMKVHTNAVVIEGSYFQNYTSRITPFREERFVPGLIRSLLQLSVEDLLGDVAVQRAEIREYKRADS